MTSKSGGMSGAAAFLEKLYDILDDAAHYSEYIAWQPSGDAFLIKKVDGLQDHVLPRFFKHSNLQSFVRQLNMYGFSKTSHDPSHREFRNPTFIKGRRDLLGQIKRKAQNQSTHAGGEPEGVLPPSSSSLAAGSAVRPRAQSASSPSFFAAAAPTASAGRQRQSSSGSSSTDDAGAESEDLRWRVAQLETKTWILSERYQELTARHDSLCNLLGSALSNSGAWAGGGAGAENKAVLTSVIRAWADGTTKTSLSAGDSSSSSGIHFDFNLHALSSPGPGSELVRMISIEQVTGAHGTAAGAAGGAAVSGSGSGSGFGGVGGVGGVGGAGGRDRGLLDLVDAATFSVGGHGHGQGGCVSGEAVATDEESMEEGEASAGRKRGGGNKFSVDRLEGERLSRTRTV